MKRRIRLRRMLKRVGLAGSAVFLAAWGVSVFFTCDHIRYKPSDALSAPGPSRGQRLSASLSRGCLCLSKSSSGRIRISSLWHFGLSRGPILWRTTRYPMVAGSSAVGRPSNLQAIGTEVCLPLWIPFLLTAVPTGFLCYRDRRIPPGHCQSCGYDLTGNVSRVCPECGNKV